MTRLTAILIWLTLICPYIHAQNTPEALGQFTFNCFQQNKLDSFYTLIPSVAEISAFGKTVGTDSNAEQYKQFVKQYPFAVKDFKDRCNQLLTDTIDYAFSWASAKLDKIETSEKILPLDNHDPNSRTVTLTLIDIYFFSNNKRLKLSIGDANAYNGTWKPGNNIGIARL
jgi:hypothetical protein